jgi:hypothetical protein
VKNTALSLLAKPALSEAGEEAAKELDVEKWAKKSHSLAEREAYTQDLLEHLGNFTDPKKNEPFDLSDEYLRSGGEVSRVRVVEAGFRLGAILNDISGT